MSELYTVSVLKRVDMTVRADSMAHAIAQAAPWWNSTTPNIDGNVLLGVVKGTERVKSGHEPHSGPTGKPPSAPTPGTPTIRGPEFVEARAA